MKFKIKKDVFEENINIARKAVNNRSPLPLLSHLLLECKENKIRITSTDLDLGIKCEFDPISIDREGETTIPAADFSSLLSKIQNDEIIIEKLDNDRLLLKTEKSRYTFNTIPSEDFPQLPPIKEIASLTLSQKTLKSMIKNVIIAVAPEEDVRNILSGVSFVLEDNKITMVSTDTRRLAIYEETINKSFENKIKFIVPQKVLKELIKILKDSNDDVNIYLSEGHIFFVLSNIIILSRLKVGNYPSYSKALPQVTNTNIELKANTLYSALQRSLIMAKDMGTQNLVIFEINGNNLFLKANSQNLGEGLEEIPITKEGANLNISFNGKYIMESLVENIDKTVKFSFISSKNAGYLTLTDNDKYIYIIMPVRKKGDEQEKEKSENKEKEIAIN